LIPFSYVFVKVLFCRQWLRNRKPFVDQLVVS